MDKVYEINKDNIVNDIKNIIDFTPEDIGTVYDFIYKDNRGNERKINFIIQKELYYNGKEFFNHYNTEMRTYINNDKVDYHYAEYCSFDDEKGRDGINHMIESRVYNIDFIFHRINEFNENN